MTTADGACGPGYGNHYQQMVDVRGNVIVVHNGVHYYQMSGTQIGACQPDGTPIQPRFTPEQDWANRQRMFNQQMQQHAQNGGPTGQPGMQGPTMAFVGAPVPTRLDPEVLISVY